MISGIELIINWLSPWLASPGQVGPRRPAKSALPFVVVSRPAGSDDKVTDSGIYQVDTFHYTVDTAERLALDVHKRMLSLGPPLAAQQRVTISTGRVFVDSVTTSQSPVWMPGFVEAAPIERFVARYAVDIRMPRIRP